MIQKHFMLSTKNKNLENYRAVFNKMKTIVIIVFALVNLTSCSKTNIATTRETTKNDHFTKINSPTTAKQHISSELQQWNKKQKIKLLPHQLIPIDYLEKNKNLKGLLLYHYLGTGKTHIALGFCKRHPNKKVVIFAPNFLQSHWLEHIKAYGISDQKRYEFISHEMPQKLASTNLKNTIVVIDESARFIEKILLKHSNKLDLYTRVYLNIQKAHRVLSLTGTPIYSNVTNLAYQINLVTGQSLLPFNKEHFKSRFTQINKTRSFFRGHFLESMAAPPVTALTAVGIGFAITTNPPIIVGSLLAGFFIPMGLKTLYPLEKTPLRYFNLSLLKKIGERYISYYNFDLSNKEHYPTSSIKICNIEYNKPQLDFLLRFFDGGINTNELLQLMKDEDKNYSRKYVDFNSNILQDMLKTKPGGGEQVGNLLFAEKQNQTKIIYPNKFFKILDLLRSNEGSAVMYSHYYHNGILLFTKFLDAHGYQNWYKILTPNLNIKEHAKIISDYNNGKIKLLLLHPDITEGISLKGTQQLHLLETPYNRSFQEQIIGRTVRYRSHTHLSKNKRHVAVYIWKQILPIYGSANNIALRNNWHQNFSEINYYSNGGNGRLQLDPNATLKKISPDEMAFIHQNNLAVSTKKLREHLTKFSIENHYVRKQ